MNDQTFIRHIPMTTKVPGVDTTVKKDQNSILKDRLNTPLIGGGSLNINIKRYFVNTSGQLLAKGTEPAIFRNKSYPVYMLGNFDRIGGYQISNKIVPPPAGISFFCTFVFGYDVPFLSNTGFSELPNFVRRGDVVTVFTDDVNNPSAFCLIVQTVEIGSLASIISNTQTSQKDGKIGFLKANSIAYQVDVDAQLFQGWQFITCDNLGQFKSNPFNPGGVQKSPYYKLSDFLDLGIGIPQITQYIGIAFNMLYSSDVLNVNFKIVY